MKEMRDQPIMRLLESMGIEKRMNNILLHAIGMINRSQSSSEDEQTVASLEFYMRIAKYLRSIGYYGDSPFMMCNYGSSEYAQAFSRVGSLFGNIYIVNDDLDLQEFKVNEDSKLTELELNYNNESFKVPEGCGLIMGHHYRQRTDELLGKPLDSSVYTTHQMLRSTIISTQPVLDDIQSLSTYSVPPESKDIGNVNPIRVCQQTFHVDACPRGSYLIMF
jgi:RAB protein geranylgeranyltransferase component A